MNNHSEVNSSITAILEELETKGNLENSAKETGKDLLIGIAGAAVGVWVGKPSLMYGLGAAFAGHYYHQPRLTSLGLGLITSGSFAIGQAIKAAPSGTVGGLDGMKEKFKLLGTNLKEAFYLDKLMKSTPKTKDNTVAGLDDVTHFNPNEGLDMGALNAIEDEITRNSQLYEKRQMDGTDEDVSGNEDEISGAEEEISGIEERLY
jgi:hypothetical protein